MSRHGQCSLPETRSSDHRGAQEGKHGRCRDTRRAMQGRKTGRRRNWDEASPTPLVHIVFCDRRNTYREKKVKRELEAVKCHLSTSLASFAYLIPVSVME